MRPFAPVILLWLAGCGAKTGLIDDRRPSRDAGEDSGVDSGIDAGLDAGPDSGPDSGVDAGPGDCGDGVVDPGEECDLGDRNRLVPAIAIRQNGEESLPWPIVADETALAHYDYRSESAHTGLEQPRGAELFFYEEWRSRDDFLFFVFSEDDGGFDGTGAIDVEDLEGRDADLIVIGDEPQELVLQGPGHVAGRYAWFSNSDGGVVRLECPLVARVTPGDTTFIDSWTWHGGDGAFQLDENETFELECNAVPTPCRPDCRLPRCGDDYLDPGEQCEGPDCPPGCLAL